MSSEIIRTSTEAGNWWIGNKHWAENPLLSLRAKGLMAYLFSKPPDWTVKVADIVNNNPEGRDSIRNILTELEEHGYLHRIKNRQKDGQFIHTTVLFDIPPDGKTPIPANLASAWESGPGQSGDGSPGDGNSGALISNNSIRNNTGHENFKDLTWQHKFATRALSRLEQLYGDGLHLAIKRRAEDIVRRYTLIQEWAGVFDKMNRIDGIPQVEIGLFLKWLLDEENWWIRTGNFYSFSNIRISKHGERKLDKLLHAMSKDGTDAKPKVKPAQINTTFE